jgi:hypothetical protein
MRSKVNLAALLGAVALRFEALGPTGERQQVFR